MKNAKYQHEPVIAPHNWSDEERRLVYSIDRLFDEVYQKIGALTERVKALEPDESESDNG